jgi:hypothetical protein
MLDGFGLFERFVISSSRHGAIDDPYSKTVKIEVILDIALNAPQSLDLEGSCDDSASLFQALFCGDARASLPAQPALVARRRHDLYR